eukprot:12035326-Alexandrium_andersonii.AAC.1
MSLLRTGWHGVRACAYMGTFCVPHRAARNQSGRPDQPRGSAAGTGGTQVRHCHGARAPTDSAPDRA